MTLETYKVIFDYDEEDMYRIVEVGSSKLKVFKEYVLSLLIVSADQHRVYCNTLKTTGPGGQ